MQASRAKDSCACACVLLFFAGALASCTGDIGEPGGLGRNDPSPTGGANPPGSSSSASASSPEPCVQNASFAPPRLWRVNDPQYANVVPDVFGASISVPVEVSEGVSVGSEEPSTDSLAIADNTRVHNYMNTAETIAQAATQNLTALMGCSMSDASCVETFIRNKVSRAFRRPLAEAEVQDVLALYRVGAADSPAIGVETVLEYVLQSPYFLWRAELGAQAAGAPMEVPLGPIELASALI